MLKRLPASVLRVSAVVAAVLWAVGVAGCAGASCHSDDGCASGLSCVGPNAGPSCGIPPQRDCASTSDCSGGEVCHAIFDPCSPTGVGSECDTPCKAGACGTGFRCNAAGACEPLPCDAGFACASYQRCEPSAADAPGPVYDQTQGCVTVTCAADADCTGSTVCVDGTCQTGVGHCEAPMEVP